VRFATIYPAGIQDALHISTSRRFVDDRNVITRQLYFPDPITEHIYATTEPYRERKG
jgi:hypothetical protein